MATRAQLKKQEELRLAASNPNVQRMLYAIRMAEGTQNEENRGANTLVGYGKFNSYADHPRKVVRVRRGLHSSAAGSYQIIQGTWDGLKKQYGFSDFTPETQDLAAIALIKGRGALNDVMRGNWQRAIPKLNREWASFPGDVYGQGGKNMRQMLGYLGADPSTFGVPAGPARGNSLTPPVNTAALTEDDFIADPLLGNSVMTAAQPTPQEAAQLALQAGSFELPTLFGEPASGSLAGSSLFGTPAFAGMRMTYDGQPMVAIPESESEARSLQQINPYEEDLRGKLVQLLGQVETAENQLSTGRPMFNTWPTLFDDRILGILDEV